MGSIGSVSTPKATLIGDGESFSRLLQRKFTLGRKSGAFFMVYIVLCIGLLGFLQLLVYESRWGWGRSELNEIALTSRRIRQLSGNFVRQPSNDGQQVFTEFSNFDTLDMHSDLNASSQQLAPIEEVACMQLKLLLASYRSSDGLNVDKIIEECLESRKTKRSQDNSVQLAQNLDSVEDDPDAGGTTEGQDTDTVSPVDINHPKNELLESMPGNTFLPLKDVTQEGLSDLDTNWFMSGLRGRRTNGSAESFDLPRDDPHGRILCVRGNHTSNGTKNSYGLFSKVELPPNFILMRGITLVADNYWDYYNPWHSMSALVNFASWRLENQCKRPDRVLLYHWGELVPTMGTWITHVMQASHGKRIPVETLAHSRDLAVCFERSVIQRRGLGGIRLDNMNTLFDMLRCKVRNYCGQVSVAREKAHKVEVLLLTRTGARAFANASAVAAVMRSECKKVAGCNMRVANIGELTFCEQVKLMSTTDVLVTVHGAHETNMMWMSPGSRVMEMFPKGWLEYAGIGQHIYKWLADWTRVVHEGTWQDPEGPDCPYPKTETLPCLLFFKDREVGLNATHLAHWTADVLQRFVKIEKKTDADADSVDGLCSCHNEDAMSILKKHSQS